MSDLSPVRIRLSRPRVCRGPAALGLLVCLAGPVGPIAHAADGGAGEGEPAARTQASVRRQVPARFPLQARRLGLSRGTCRVAVALSRSGRPQDVAVTGCVEVFADEARRAVRRWRWYPARVDGRPVETSVVLSMAFADGRVGTQARSVDAGDPAEAQASAPSGDAPEPTPVPVPVSEEEGSDADGSDRPGDGGSSGAVAPDEATDASERGAGVADGAAEEEAPTRYRLPWEALTFRSFEPVGYPAHLVARYGDLPLVCHAVVDFDATGELESVTVDRCPVAFHPAIERVASRWRIHPVQVEGEAVPMRSELDIGMVAPKTP